MWVDGAREHVGGSKLGYLFRIRRTNLELRILAVSMPKFAALRPLLSEALKPLKPPET